ncbi:primosomal protein N' [Lacihabitans sp. LS3-19]|uniref:replication restart helicase PriA n=1 Tax=Lacihabitans sp. LS3-19 TaxID=2487335 RepID=UPI0020CEC9D1|nr:primosomal protein N' [Lacihabitans sp. LS3-19]MCP9766567.1 primosomal protein N' [Lacihabitans sp. LS3-19]
MSSIEEAGFDLEQTSFVDVVLPVPIPQYFTYRVSREMAPLVKVGSRVVVEFGKSRVLTAIIVKIHNIPPPKYQAKYILELLDIEPVVTKTQLWLFEWVAEYYMCHVGEVMNVALPAGLKISSQSKVQYNPDFAHPELLTEEEQGLMDVLVKEDSMTYEEVGRLLEKTDITKTLKDLVAKHAVILFEEVKDKYKPKIVKRVKLKRVYEGSEEVFDLIEKLEKTTKQQEVLLEYLNHVPINELHFKNKEGVAKSILKAGDISESSLKTLIDKGIFEEFEVVVSRFDEDIVGTQAQMVLSERQVKASDQIMEAFVEKEIVLFHGITGSGKTEIYIDLIQKVLQSGSQVLFLLPEIALTTQIVNRLKVVFGDSMGVYHSKFSDNERVEVWKGILEGKFQFVVGVRSAIFLPFDNLGLIIVDEEHEASYKQFDPAPRYHARDVAIMLALKVRSKVLLGSATPSIESYFQAKNDKYGFVVLKERYGDAQLPEIRLVDLKKERKEKTLEKEFSSELLAEMKHNLDHKQQSIIFLNRRGYAPYLNCQECNWIGHCDQCAVTLTYHLSEKTLVCHYCGHKETAPKTCPDCGSTKVNTVGVGTEKIEEDLYELFPEAKILRMDLDTTRSKNAYQAIIGEFEKGEVDILVGTQMVSKGLDFDHVSLVGIYNADKMIHFPDFRAAERAFQLITQVSGRAGRREQKGRVLIQTGNPQNRILQYVLQNDYEGFYASEVIDREGYNYPPFSRIIEITIKDINQVLASQAATRLAQALEKTLGKTRVMGPEKSLVERIRNKYLFEVWLKLEKDKMNIQATKALLKQEIVNLITDKKFKSVQVIVNVDAI